MSDDLTTFLAREHDRVKEGPATRDCRDDEFWARLSEGLITGAERDDLIRHISQCPSCRKQTSAILKEMDISKLGLGPSNLISDESERGGTIIRLWPVRLAIAATIAVAIGAGLYFGLGRRGPLPGPIDFGVDARPLLLAEADLTQLGLDLDHRTKQVLLPQTIDEATYKATIVKLKPHIDKPSPSPDALALAARAALSAGFYKDAIGYAEQWTKAAPNDPKASNALGLARFQRGLFGPSQEAFERAISLAPQTPSYHLNAALAADEAGKVDLAIQHLKRFIELSPNHPNLDQYNRLLKKLQTSRK